MCLYFFKCVRANRDRVILDHLTERHISFGSVGPFHKDVVRRALILLVVRFQRSLMTGDFVKGVILVGIAIQLGIKPSFNQVGELIVRNQFLENTFFAVTNLNEHFDLLVALGVTIKNLLRDCRSELLTVFHLMNECLAQQLLLSDTSFR